MLYIKYRRYKIILIVTNVRNSQPKMVWNQHDIYQPLFNKKKKNILRYNKSVKNAGENKFKIEAEFSSSFHKLCFKSYKLKKIL